VARPYGPGLAAFSAGGNCAEGAGCHPRYGLTPSSTHANNAKNLRSTPSDNGYVGATLATTQVCRNCHSTYTSTRITASGDNLVRIQANWDDNTFFVDCLTCHNGTAAGTQATANLDGSGGVAHAIEGTLFTMQHGLIGLGCGWCHYGNVGHIGANRPVGSNPYRLDGYFFTSYPPITQMGQIDWSCNYCHAMFSGYDHTWRVSGTGSSGPETKGTADTHPTTVLAVGAGKDRWYQLPSSTLMPLYGDLLDNNYNKSGGTNNYVLCVTCHDPHGLGTSPLSSSVRRFSGQNTDTKGNKALRYNYSTGTPTALCSQCHK
jgi:ribosomal protein L31